MNNPCFELRARAEMDPNDQEWRISLQAGLHQKHSCPIRVQRKHRDGVYCMRVQGINEEQCLTAQGLLAEDWETFQASPPEDVYREMRIRIATALRCS